jgi:WD40 repeat protein
LNWLVLIGYLSFYLKL